MINTLNESGLHKALKSFYAVQFSAQEEVQAGPWICDLIQEDGSVIEIQNKNVSALRKKILGLLAQGRHVTVVHPIVIQKTIETRDQDGNVVSQRKSPKKESLYSALREFTGIADILLKKNFSLLLPEIETLEKRIQTQRPEQSKNGRRRFKKPWQKTGKELLAIKKERLLDKKKDWLSLLPQEILQENKKSGAPFSAADIKKIFLLQGNEAAAEGGGLVLWLFTKMGLVKRLEGQKRPYLYQLA